MERIRQRAVISPSYNPPISQTTLGKGRVPQDTLTAFLSPIIFFPINILAHFGQNRFHLIWLLLTLQSRPWKKHLRSTVPFTSFHLLPATGQTQMCWRLAFCWTAESTRAVIPGLVPHASPECVSRTGPRLPLDASLFLPYTLY